MAAIQDQLEVFHDSAFPISTDAHSQRVARLAVEVARRLHLEPKSIHVVSEAAIQHHAVEMVWTNNERGLRVKELAESQECLQTLRIFYGLQEPTPGKPTTLFAEILQLANAFDEKFEWRVFDSGPGSKTIQCMSMLGKSGLWSEPVHQAFQAIFAGKRDQALAKAESLPFSIVSRIQGLALPSTEELTVDQLERLALADSVLSAALLRHINSAKYSSTAGMFASSSLHRLWKHSIRCANTMSTLAEQAGLDQHRAFLLGLLHDIGRISLEWLGPVTASGYTGFCDTEAPAVWIEIATAGCDHAELGADVLAQSHFPESITESVRYHHSPELSADTLTSLLYLVETTAGENEDLVSGQRFEAALSRLQMSHKQFRQYAFAGKSGSPANHRAR